MDNHYLRELLYPLKVSSTIASVLSAKLYDLREWDQQQRDRISKENDLRRSQPIDLATLSSSELELLNDYRAAKARYEELSTLVGQKYVVYGEKVYAATTQEGIAASSKKMNEDYAEHQKEREARYAKLRDVAREMVEAKIKETRSRVPKELIEKLDRV